MRETKGSGKKRRDYEGSSGEVSGKRGGESGVDSVLVIVDGHIEETQAEEFNELSLDQRRLAWELSKGCKSRDRKKGRAGEGTKKGTM